MLMNADSLNLVVNGDKLRTVRAIAQEKGSWELQTVKRWELF